MATETLDLTFLNGANAHFLAELYSKFLENPAAVDEQWRGYFEQLHEESGVDAALRDSEGPSWAPRGNKIIGAADPAN